MSHKLGPGLHVQLGALERAQREREAQRETVPAAAPTDSEGAAISEATRVTVFVRFTGELDRLREAGLMTEMVSGDVVLGSAALGELERLAALDEVLSINEDQQHRTMLNHSVPAIHADQVRTGALGLTGKGVVVGIVDTGIDIFHENFQTDAKQTRILSLLDLTVPNMQTLWLSGVPTGGSFTLAWTVAEIPDALTTAAIPFDATAAAVEAALVALPSGAFNHNDVNVAGGPLPQHPVTVDLSGGRWANHKVALLAQGLGTALTGGSSPAVETAPGKVFTADDINAALPHADRPFPSTDDSAHGTHVAGIAAGDGSQSGNCCPAGTYIGVAPNADLVIVKSDLVNSNNVRGAKYVFFVADNKLPGPEPAVVNISSGTQIGPHDGTAADERCYDNMLRDATQLPIEGRAIVVSAGNDGAVSKPIDPSAVPPGLHDAKPGLHAATSVPHNQTVSLKVNVPASDNKSDTIDIWYEGAARLELTLTVLSIAPKPWAAGAVPAPPNDGTITTYRALAGSAVKVQTAVNVPPTTWPDGTPRNKHEIVIEILPPHTTPPATGTGPIWSGSWTITLRETAGTGTPVNAWIRLDDSEANLMFDPAQQTSSGTITAPGSARNVITVGSYDYRNSSLDFYSSRGPTTDNRPKPELVAPGLGIMTTQAGDAHRWWWWDCCCDFYKVDNGTSMAAPHVTGVVALLLERNPHLTFDEIRSFLTLNCMPPSPSTGGLPNNDWGHGIVDAEAAANAVPAAAHARTAERPVRLPAGATWTVRAVTPKRIAALRARLGSDPRGAVLAALVSTHFDEVKRLVNTNRRILIVWHRMGGPELLGRLMRYADTGRPELPLEASGRPLVEWVERMLGLLYEYGSPALRADVARHRDLALALVSSSLPAYDEGKLAS